MARAGVPRSNTLHAGGELRGLSTTYTALPGSSQLVHFSNDKLTIAAKIEVEDIRDGVRW